MLCAAIRIVFPRSFNPRKSSQTSPAPCLSRPLKGSSNIKSSGSSMIACAIPRRSRIPREYCPTFFLDRGSSPRARIVALTSSSEIRCFRDASLFKFAKPLRSRKKPGFSMIMPTESGKSSSFPICFPPTSTVPLSGCKNPQMHLNITVFPEPLNPIIP